MQVYEGGRAATWVEQLRAHYQQELDSLRQKATPLRGASPATLSDPASSPQPEDARPSESSQPARPAVLFVHNPAADPAAADGAAGPVARGGASGSEDGEGWGGSEGGGGSKGGSYREASEAGGTERAEARGAERAEAAEASGVRTTTMSAEEVANLRAKKRADKLAAKAEAWSQRASVEAKRRAGSLAGGAGAGEDAGGGDSSDSESVLSRDDAEDDHAEWWVPRLMKGTKFVKVSPPPDARPAGRIRAEAAPARPPPGGRLTRRSAPWGGARWTSPTASWWSPCGAGAPPDSTPTTNPAPSLSRSASPVRGGRSPMSSRPHPFGTLHPTALLPKRHSDDLRRSPGLSSSRANPALTQARGHSAKSREWGGGGDEALTFLHLLPLCGWDCGGGGRTGLW